MIEATEIWLNRAEGPRGQTGERTLTGPNIWAQADKVTRNWSMTAPKEYGYDKVDFKVTFADGFVYEGRLDMTYTEYLLDVHILSGLRFLTGGSERAELVLKFSKFDVKQFRHILATYKIGD